MRRVVSLVLLAGTLGCSFVFQELNAPGFNEQLVGKQKAEVVQALGQPELRKTMRVENREYEVWHYRISQKKKINQVGISYYRVLFLDGKVKQWERIKLYAQPSFEFEEPARPVGHVPTIHLQKTTYQKSAE